MIGNEYQQPYQAVSGSGNNQGFDMAQGQLVINNDGMIDEAPPSKDEMMAIFSLCRNNHWNSCLQCLRTNPEIGVTTMTMENNIKTSVLHQAITSKGDIKQRAIVIRSILETTPQAARIKNGYGSLALHVLCQRNTKMDSKTKDSLIRALINAYPGALTTEGGVGRRNPLHICFTDYLSPSIIRVMIDKGKHGTFARDKRGWLPIHVAVSRHCSPEKLEMLLEANPSSINARTYDGMSLLDLAKKTATQSHPNNALIQALKKKMQEAGVVVERVGSSQSIDYVTASVSSDDTTDTPTTTTTTTRPKSTSARSKRSARKRASSYGTVTVKQEDPSAWGSPSADTLPSADILLDSNRATRSGTRTRSCGGAAIKQEDEGENPADLLLHFSRNSDSPSKRFKAATQYAEV